MVNPKIVEETPLGLAEIKAELEEIKKRDKELDSRASRMEDYLNQFNTLNNESYEKLVEELNKLEIPRLRKPHIIKIIDILPETVDDLKIILQGYTLTVTNKNLKKIVNVTSKFIPKQK